MKSCLTIVVLLTTVSAIIAEDIQDQDLQKIAPEGKPRPVGVVYLVQLLSPRQVKEDPSETNDAITNLNRAKELEDSRPNLNVVSNPEKVNREKRSPGGGCHRCGGGGGGGGYPGGGHHGGGGGGGGGGFGSSGSWSQSSSSAGSYGHGGGFGKGK